MSESVKTPQVVQPANDAQIAAFKIGAAMRYKERGVQPEHADILFNAHLDKVANEMGIDVQPLSPKAQKAAAVLKQAFAKK